MSKQNVKTYVGLFLIVLLFASCAAPTYLPLPSVAYPGIQNTGTFGVQNLDEKANVESNVLTCHYDGFDVKFKISSDFIVSFEIINNSNKSLIIDKSKSYVLYSGYSSQLFKDVRSSRSTTFNNVQDAINNVQTNEAGVSMTIPPYSKWALPIQETNIRAINPSSLPPFSKEIGVHPLTAYDNNETVEFVITYSYDYSMAKWDTSRNRIYVNSVEVTKKEYTQKTAVGPIMMNSTQYWTVRQDGEPDLTEVNRIYAINLKRYKKHNRQVRTSRIIWGIVTLPTITGPILCWLAAAGNCSSHLPPRTNGQETFIFSNGNQ
jgi:hypothetical protein